MTQNVLEAIFLKPVYNGFSKTLDIMRLSVYLTYSKGASALALSFVECYIFVECSASFSSVQPSGILPKDKLALVASFGDALQRTTDTQWTAVPRNIPKDYADLFNEIRATTDDFLIHTTTWGSTMMGKFWDATVQNISSKFIDNVFPACFEADPTAVLAVRENGEPKDAEIVAKVNVGKAKTKVDQFLLGTRALSKHMLVPLLHAQCTTSHARMVSLHIHSLSNDLNPVDKIDLVAIVPEKRHFKSMQKLQTLISSMKEQKVEAVDDVACADVKVQKKTIIDIVKNVDGIFLEHVQNLVARWNTVLTRAETDKNELMPEAWRIYTIQSPDPQRIRSELLGNPNRALCNVSSWQSLWCVSFKLVCF